MNRDSEELVPVAAGTAIEMELLKQDLLEAGIEVRVMGEDLDIGLGTLLPGSVKLVVFENDVARARAVLEPGKQSREQEKFPHPVSDPKPKGQGGQGPHTHYNADPRS